MRKFNEFLTFEEAALIKWKTSTEKIRSLIFRSFELFELSCCSRQGFKDFGILLTLRQISLGHQHVLLR